MSIKKVQIQNAADSTTEVQFEQTDKTQSAGQSSQVSTVHVAKDEVVGSEKGEFEDLTWSANRVASTFWTAGKSADTQDALGVMSLVMDTLRAGAGKFESVAEDIQADVVERGKQFANSLDDTKFMDGFETIMNHALDLFVDKE